MQIYYQITKLLRSEMPPPCPVVIRRVKMNDNEGFCLKKDQKFHIRINKSLNETKTIDVLLHEWAHALTWKELNLDELSDDEFRKAIHGPEWGLAYSKVYQLFEKHFIE